MLRKDVLEVLPVEETGKEMASASILEENEISEKHTIVEHFNRSGWPSPIDTLAVFRSVGPNFMVSQDFGRSSQEEVAIFSEDGVSTATDQES